MGFTNFTQHNPTEANQLSNPDFAADSLTTGGIGTDAIMPSNWMNARWYEDSTFITAFAQALANKGYTINKDNIATLAATLGNVLTNADTKPAQVNVAYSANPVFDGSLANGFLIGLAGNVTSSTFINYVNGQVYTFFITSNSPGNFSFAYPSNFAGPPFFFPNVQTQSTGNVLTLEVIVLAPYVYPLDTFIGIMQAAIQTINGQISALQSEDVNLQNQINSVNANKQNNLGYTPVQQGTGFGQLPNSVKIGWSGSQLLATVDNSDLGAFLFTSSIGGSLTGNGWVRLQNGLIIQWATGTIVSSSAQVFQNIFFPIAFPNTCFIAMPGTNWSSGDSADIGTWQVDGTPNTGGVTMVRARSSHITTNQVSAPTVIAIGF